MNITPTKEEWIQNYLKTYHKRPYTESKILEARREYERKYDMIKFNRLFEPGTKVRLFGRKD